jgi:hypothetical protein
MRLPLLKNSWGRMSRLPGTAPLNYKERRTIYVSDVM